MMDNFRVIGTDTYCREVAKWSSADQEAASKIPQRLAGNPYLGDPLGLRFFREKRIREKRIYYLVYDDLKLVLMVATSGKKDQQSTIDHVKEHLDEFRKVAEDVTRQVF